jgi:hypothetical protein
LYRAAHFLKVIPLRKALAAALACRVFFEKTPSGYSLKKEELKVKGELSSKDTNEYRERFPFMN